MFYWDFPGGPLVKDLPSNAGDTGLMPDQHRNPPIQWVSSPVTPRSRQTAQANWGEGADEDSQSSERTLKASTQGKHHKRENKL